ncbi:MAG: hypothetical protein ABFS18_05550 [Thermodesulfobacteriota bacterium]
MEPVRKGVVGRKWYEKYLPFVAKSQEMQLEWLVDKLSRLRNSVDKERTGLLSCEELKPYISLLIEGNPGGKELGVAAGAGDVLGALLGNIKESDLLLMVECAGIYDVPRLFSLMRQITKEQAVMAMKKVPPLYEKKPLLVVDRVFHAIKEKSTELLEDAAAEIMGSDAGPIGFVDNYERFRGVMMDEQILSILYPKAN